VHVLLKGGAIYEVAKPLGDVIATVEKHCAPLVTEVRERTS